MRETCTSGSEGGGTEPNRFSLPLSDVARSDMGVRLNLLSSSASEPLTTIDLGQ